MRITKAQKDAVINLLQEKFDEKQKIENEKFYKEHEAEIALDKQEYIEYIDAMNDVCAKLNDLREKFNQLFKRSEYLNDKISRPSISFNYGNNRWRIIYDYSTSPELLKSVNIDAPDYYKVERQLELDTLSKDFNIDKFIQKYIKN